MDAALDDRTMRRIAALLVSLAVIAERAAGRSFPVRFVLLCILRRAEAVALSFVVETIEIDWSCFVDDLDTGYDPIDTLVVALRLRTLASLVFALADPVGWDDGWTAGRNPVFRASSACQRPATPRGWNLEYADTS